MNAIYVNSKGDWKLSGFNFAINMQSSGNAADIQPYLLQFPEYCTPNMDYLAPEIVNDDSCSPASDVWSLGCLIYALFNEGETVIKCHQNIGAYKECIVMLNKRSASVAKSIPQSLVGAIQTMFVVNPNGRLALAEFQTNEFFNNLLVNTVKFFESLVEKTTIEKLQFLKGLPKVLPQYSDRFILRKMLPGLLEELKDPAIVPFILPNLFIIIERLSEDVFASKILPALKPIFQSREPPQAILLLLSRCDLLVSKCPNSEVMKQNVLPLVYNSIETPIPQIQEMGLKALSKMSEKLDLGTIKSVLLPKLCTVYESSSTISVKVNTLIGIQSIIKVLDKFTITEKILPVLTKRMREPTLLMTILDLYEECAKLLDDSVIASMIIPELWKICLDPLFSLHQFEKIEKVIRHLTDRIFEKHKKHMNDVTTVQGGDVDNSLRSNDASNDTFFSQVMNNKQATSKIRSTSGNLGGFDDLISGDNTAHSKSPDSNGFGSKRSTSFSMPHKPEVNNPWTNAMYAFNIEPNVPKIPPPPSSSNPLTSVRPPPTMPDYSAFNSINNAQSSLHQPNLNNVGFGSPTPSIPAMTSSVGMNHTSPSIYPSLSLGNPSPAMSSGFSQFTGSNGQGFGTSSTQNFGMQSMMNPMQPTPASNYPVAGKQDMSTFDPFK